MSVLPTQFSPFAFAVRFINTHIVPPSVTACCTLNNFTICLIKSLLKASGLEGSTEGGAAKTSKKKLCEANKTVGKSQEVKQKNKHADEMFPDKMITRASEELSVNSPG